MAYNNAFPTTLDELEKYNQSIYTGGNVTLNPAVSSNVDGNATLAYLAKQQQYVNDHKYLKSLANGFIDLANWGISFTQMLANNRIDPLNEEIAEDLPNTVFNDRAAINKAFKNIKLQEYEVNPNGFAETFLTGFVRNLPQFAVQVAAHIAGGGLLSGGLMAAQIAGGQYGELADKNIDNDVANTASISNATIQSALETVSMDYILKFPGGKGIVKTLMPIAKSLMSEGLTEAIQELPEQLSNIYAEHPDWNPMQIAQEWWKNKDKNFEGMAMAGLIGAAYGGAVSSVNVAVNSYANKAATEVQKQKVELLKEVCEEDVKSGINPDYITGAVNYANQEAGNDSTIFVEAEPLQAYMQNVSDEQKNAVAQKLGVTPDDITEMAQEGMEIETTIGGLRGANAEMGGGLIDAVQNNIRFGLDEYSVNGSVLKEALADDYKATEKITADLDVEIDKLVADAVKAGVPKQQAQDVMQLYKANALVYGGDNPAQYLRDRFNGFVYGEQANGDGYNQTDNKIYRAKYFPDSESQKLQDKENTLKNELINAYHTETVEKEMSREDADKLWQEKYLPQMEKISSDIYGDYYFPKGYYKGLKYGRIYRSDGDVKNGHAMLSELGSNREQIEAYGLDEKFVKVSEEEARNFFLTDAGDVFGGLSYADERLIKLQKHGSIASWDLRKGKDSANAKKLKDIINRSAMGKTTLYRGIKGEHADLIKKLKIGETYTDKGFMATDSDIDVAKKFAGDNGVVMKIVTPEGMNYGIGIDMPFEAKYSDENETLLNAGLELKLIDVSDGVYTFNVVPPVTTITGTNNSDKGVDFSNVDIKAFSHSMIINGKEYDVLNFDGDNPHTFKNRFINKLFFDYRNKKYVKNPFEDTREFLDKAAKAIEEIKQKGTITQEWQKNIDDYNECVNIFEQVTNPKSDVRIKDSDRIDAPVSSWSYYQTACESLKDVMSKWSDVIDKFMAGNLNVSAPINVMQTPLIIQNFGHVKQLPIQIDVSVIGKILNGKHKKEITPDVLKQVPGALTRPMFLFKTSHKGNNKPMLGIVLSLKGKNGIPVFVPILLEESVGGDGVAVHKIASAYERDAMGKPSSQWFRDVLGGSNGKPTNLLYIDKKKIAAWSRSLGPQLPTELDYRNNPLLHNIPNEDDLVKLKNENPTMYQQDLGATSWDAAGRATINKVVGQLPDLCHI